MVTELKILPFLAVLSCLFAAPAAAWTPLQETSEQLATEAEALIDKNRAVQAVDLLEQSIVANPLNASAFSQLARAYAVLDRPVEVKKYARIASTIEPNDIVALSLLGELHLQDDDLQKAQMNLDRLSRICGGECTEYKRLANAMTQFQPRAQ